VNVRRIEALSWQVQFGYGWVEDCGIRCNYHGWKFDESGACIHQPCEEVAHPDARFRERVKIKAYRAEAKAGLVFAYMGLSQHHSIRPGKALHTRTVSPTSSLLISPATGQSRENSIDPVHFEWLHNNWSARQVDELHARPIMPGFYEAVAILGFQRSAAASTRQTWHAFRCVP
jgi:phenylpropionate dioxygenase-like ring-hydroxylating dioxygenase large terminal subunit